MGSEADCQALVRPDTAVCADCLRELFDDSDRRFRYPFINCAHCGPRFTIILDVPGDQPFTTVATEATFQMCPACQAEHDEPTDRRFRAQPNSCWKCGPKVLLCDRRGRPIEAADPIAEAAQCLMDGAVVAVKGLGGFHLAVDATNSAAVDVLRERKGRERKPFAIMAPDLAAVRRFCDVDEVAAGLLESPPRPIVLLDRRSPTSIADSVAPGNPHFGVFLPNTPLEYLLLAAGRTSALVMTSGNLSEEPTTIDNHEAIRRLGELADYLLLHDRDILQRCDDSVVRVVAGRARQIRRARGYVPVALSLRDSVPPILAVGGELKNTICLARDRCAFVGPHVGDLENPESYRLFEDSLAHLRRVLGINPELIAHDLHPDYFPTRWALGQSSLRRVAVQHHHAHIASCMAENHLSGRVIGIALDGTGYGSDGHVWGGEVLSADYTDFERVAQLAYVPMPGGEAAIRAPWRMAISYLTMHFGDAALERLPESLRDLDPPNLEAVARMAELRTHAPLTSSCGSLFDAVASLLGIRHRITYDGQAAVELESLIDATGQPGAYAFDLRRGTSDPDSPSAPAADRWQIESLPVFEALLADIESGVPTSVISQRFHNGLIECLTEVALRTRDATGLDRVCLSGGSFHNAYLLEHLIERLERDSFTVFSHAELPTSDGGLSLGQALVAAHS